MPKKYKYVQTFTFEGKRYFVYADSEKDLARKTARKQLELENNLVVYDSRMPVKQWALTALSTYKTSLSDRALYEMKLRIQKHILPELGSIPIGKVKPVQCQQLLNSKEGFSKEYINKIYQDLNFIFRTAVENEMINKNPAANITKPKGTVTHRRSITNHEREHLLRVCDADPHYLLFLLMLYCGCRPAEAAECRANDIMVIDGISFLHIRGTKTENSDRQVPIPPYLLERIPDRDPFDVLSPNRHGRPHSLASYKRLVSHLYRDLNLSMGCRTYRNALIPPYPLAEDFVPYCLRHTYCTDLQKAGVDIRTAQKLMGHADIQTTANIYTHQDNETLKAAAKLLGCSTQCCTPPDTALK